MKLLNIYGQYDNHGEARIVGNREGLKELRRIIDKALEQGVGKSLDYPAAGRIFVDPIFASDGEGYDLVVELHTDQWGWNSAMGEKPDPNSFWNKEESNPQYIEREIQKATNGLQEQLGIDYFAGELRIKGKEKSINAELGIQRNNDNP